MAWQLRDVRLKRQFPRLLARRGYLASVLRLAESVFMLAFIEGYEASIFTTGTRQQTH